MAIYIKYYMVIYVHDKHVLMLQTFIADATKCTLDDSKKPKSQDDHIFNYGIWIIQFGLIMMQLNDTENEGDGKRAVRNSKLLILLFRTSKHAKKYAFEIFRLISKLKCQMTQQMAARTIHGRFVNWTGGKGGNCPNDLKQEHLVKFTKKLIRGMGAQKTEKAMIRATSAATGLKQIIEQFDKVSSVSPESTAHTYRNAESDIKDMTRIIQDLQVFDKKPGRAHPSFSSLPHSAFYNIDMVKLEKWMKGTKKKLEKNPDVAWEAESDEEDENDEDGISNHGSSDEDYDRNEEY